MGDRQLVLLSCMEQSRLLRSGEISPVELVRASLEQIEHHDAQWRAWITVAAERAIEQARRAEAELAAGRYRGPLHGLPYGVKDEIHASGLPTTLGARGLSDAETVAPHDATVVRRLSEGGAILLGKQSLHAWGQGGAAGSGVATATGMCSFSIGEDGDGSLRISASRQGIAGLRPTWGRISRYGGVVGGYTRDTCGPLARTVQDLALIMEGIAGHDPSDPSSSTRPVPRFRDALDHDLTGMRCAVVREIAYGEGADAETSAGFDNALGVLRDRGAIIEEISLPWARWAAPLEMMSMDVDLASWYLNTSWREHHQDFPARTRTRIAAAALIPAVVYKRVLQARKLVRRQMLDALRHHDVLLTPGAPIAARGGLNPQDDEGDPEALVWDLIRRGIVHYPFSVANVPTLCVPAGLSRSGQPLSLQIAGRPFGESAVFHVGYAFQEAA